MEPASSRQLLGAAHFKRSNPLSDRFGVLGFDHVEFWCVGGSLALTARAQARLLQVWRREQRVASFRVRAGLSVGGQV